MKYIEKYWKIIIVGLLVVIFLQCCSGCSRKQQIKFNDVQMEQVVDSFNNVINEKNDSIAILNQMLAVSNESNRQLNDANKSLKDANKRPIIIKSEQKKY